jgi:hypothetical protein
MHLYKCNGCRQQLQAFDESGDAVKIRSAGWVKNSIGADSPCCVSGTSGPPGHVNISDSNNSPSVDSTTYAQAIRRS